MERAVTRGNGLLERFLASRRVRLANRRIPASHRGGRLLDIGCGAYPYFLMNTDFSQKYGLDKLLPETQDPSHVERGFHLIRHDAGERRELPFEDGFFDVVTMLAVFEHIDPGKIVEIVREVHRVLRPRGMFLLTTPARWTGGLLRFLANVGLVSREEIEEHADAYDHPRIVGILEASGFARHDIEVGYFEGFANLWVTANKDVVSP